MFSRQKEIERENTPPLITHRSNKHYAPTNDLPLIPPVSVYDTRQVIGPVLPNNTGIFQTNDMWQNQSRENLENVSEMAYSGDQIYQPSAYTQFKDSRRQQSRLPPVSTD